MTHDPLCPVEPNPLARECRTCELIAKVRGDDLATIAMATKGYDMPADYYSGLGDGYAQGWVECVDTVGAALSLRAVQVLRGES